ncbi:DUF3800 domain-containing protein [Microcoleus sp. SVA1B1]|uniref:DUF3800 domain-containing protein n=1 Tax=Microcoleus sp. SVA1B1 TaxID=3055422 RepID=UPI002FD37A49
MHLLYLDESGHPQDPNTRFFVLAGLSIFERQTHWLDQAISPIASRFNPADPDSVEFHGGPMRTGKDGWYSFPPADRVLAVADILKCIGAAHTKGVRLFGAVIEKSLFNEQQIIEKAFECVASEFDKSLGRMYFLKKDPQRGLMVLDKSSYELQLQSLSGIYKNIGHTNGKLRNLAEVPLFLDSKASRLIQAADLIAYWIFRRYEALDDRGFKLLESYFCSSHGQKVGLIEHISQGTADSVRNMPPHEHPFP